LNNPLLYVDPLGLWEITTEEIYKTDKKGNRHLDHVNVNVKKSKEGDDAATLVKQLGVDPNSKEGKALAAKIDKQLGGGDSLQLSKLGGDVGRIFGAVEQGLTAQGKFLEAHPGSQEGPRSADCSKTTCGLAFPDVVNQLEQQGIFQVGTAGMDTVIGLMGQDFRVKSVSESELRVGDFIRYADNKGPQHFATFIFRDDNGVPKVFSKSGERGPFEIRTYNGFSSNYGTIQGRPGQRESGFYRPR
jgi:hypothetical protein